MKYTSPPKPDLPLRQKLLTMEWILFFCALTVMPLLRRHLGYRTLHPLWLLFGAAGMFVVATFSRHTPHPELLQWFAGLSLLLGFTQRFQRWREFRRGLKGHTFCLGDSLLEISRTPALLKRERRLARFVDPILCLLTGWLVYDVSPALGGWLVLAGFSLRYVEFTIRKRDQRRQMDTVDSMVEAEIQEEIVEHYSMRVDNHSDRPVDGIPTGCSADIQKTILRRTTQRAPRQ